MKDAHRVAAQIIDMSLKPGRDPIALVVETCRLIEGFARDVHQDWCREHVKEIKYVALERHPPPGVVPAIDFEAHERRSFWRRLEAEPILEHEARPYPMGEGTEHVFRLRVVRGAGGR